MHDIKEVIAFLQAKFRATIRKHLVAVAVENPLLLPWAPGAPTRMVHHPKLGRILQLRNGASLPWQWYLAIRAEVLNRHDGEFSLN